MPPKRQIRVGTQWMYARDARRALEEAIRVAETEGAEPEHQVSFLRKYVFSTDHKWIGVQYGVTALLPPSVSATRIASSSARLASRAYIHCVPTRICLLVACAPSDRFVLSRPADYTTRENTPRNHPLNMNTCLLLLRTDGFLFPATRTSWCPQATSV